MARVFLLREHALMLRADGLRGAGFLCIEHEAILTTS
jgi:hypothetical protein